LTSLRIRDYTVLPGMVVLRVTLILNMCVEIPELAGQFLAPD
jgi:hypothetical protein